MNTILKSEKTDILQIADCPRYLTSKELNEFIEGKETYQDKVHNEHIYNLSSLLEDNDEYLQAEQFKELRKEIEDLIDILNLNNCSYIRFTDF